MIGLEKCYRRNKGNVLFNDTHILYQVIMYSECNLEYVTFDKTVIFEYYFI